MHTNNQQVPLQEKMALLDLKDAMDPPGRAVYMNNWVATTDPCQDEWQGIVCDCVEVVQKLMVTPQVVQASQTLHHRRRSVSQSLTIVPT